MNSLLPIVFFLNFLRTHFYPLFLLKLFEDPLLPICCFHICDLLFEKWPILILHGLPKLEIRKKVAERAFRQALADHTSSSRLEMSWRIFITSRSESPKLEIGSSTNRQPKSRIAICAKSAPYEYSFEYVHTYDMYRQMCMPHRVVGSPLQTRPENWRLERSFF